MTESHMKMRINALDIELCARSERMVSLRLSSLFLAMSW